MVAAWVTRQLVFDGAINGLVIGLLAMGLVLVFRSTRIINFAVGNMGLVGASVLALLVLNYGWPVWLAAIVAALIGVSLGAIVELVVVRRLFNAARVTLLVATIGVAQVMQALVALLPKQRGVTAANYPLAVSGRWQRFGVSISGAQISIALAVPVIACALAWFLNRTRVGVAVIAAADNPRLARTQGINPKLVSTMVWMIAGLLATIALVLAAGLSGRASGISTLGANTLVRALTATVLAGMVSFRGAMLAGLAVGIGQALVRFNIDETGIVEFVLFVAVVAAVWVRARRDDRDSGSMSMRGALAPIPERLRVLWWVRALPTAGFAVLFLAALALPLVVDKPSRILLYGTVLAFCICALSVTVLTGWAGQLSLGQMALAGLGALTAAALSRGPVPFAASIALAAMVTAVLAVVIGLGALRVNGLLLAVVTFAFGAAATQFLYRRPLLSNDQQASVPFRRGSLFGLDLSSQRTYYYVLLAVLAVVLAALARLRRSGLGRTIIAVRDNPDSAAALTVSPVRTRVLAFALAGGIAGLGGALLAGVIQNVPLTERFFQVEHSLQLVAMAVIGGLGTLAGAVLGPLWVVGLPAFFPENELVPLFASGLGLLVLLLYVPGGLMQLVHAGRDVVVRAAERRVGPPVAKSDTRAVTTSAVVRASAEVTDDAAAAVEHITVRFGGKVAVDDVSLHVRQGEVLGLIGTNGAGKSTLLNAIGGFVASDGRVLIGGTDVTHRPAAGRAREGLGRTFQAARLFPELTVRDTVLVALEARHRSTLIGAVAGLPRERRGERAKAAVATDLIDLLGLGRYADRQTDVLSTGTRRIVELASLLAMGARVLCLDEPTAGVAQRETEALGPLLQTLRAEMNASMIVIEHDMPFITAISDRIVCLEAGRVIATGSPADIQRDPLVIASYLGTDQRAIARSGGRGAAIAGEPSGTSTRTLMDTMIEAPPDTESDMGETLR